MDLFDLFGKEQIMALATKPLYFIIALKEGGGYRQMERSKGVSLSGKLRERKEKSSIERKGLRGEGSNTENETNRERQTDGHTYRQTEIEI